MCIVLFFPNIKKTIKWGRWPTPGTGTRDPMVYSSVAICSVDRVMKSTGTACWEKSYQYADDIIKHFILCTQPALTPYLCSSETLAQCGDRSDQKAIKLSNCPIQAFRL